MTWGMPLRGLGAIPDGFRMPDEESAAIIEEGEALFNTLPIDNRYYRAFAYDEKYLTVLPAE